MALAVRGDIEKIKKLRDKAQEEGLEIVHFSYSPNSLIENSNLYTNEKLFETTGKYDIGIKTAEILFIIRKSGKLRPYEIERKTNSTGSQIDYHLKILLKKGLVEKDIKGKKMVYYKALEQ